MLDFLDAKTLLTILHLFGIAVGAGGAFASDLMFLKSVKDGELSLTEYGFLKLGGRMVWMGLVILFVSGLLLFLLDSASYLQSSKFLAKVTIVLIITGNGVLMHRVFFPRFQMSIHKDTISVGEYLSRNPIVLVSGAVSITSWSSAIVLGAISSIPYSYWVIMLGYGAVLLLAAAMILTLKNIVVEKP